MRPIRLSMQAFGPYAGEEVVDFRELEGRSFFLIHGPTGSGKTAILDAISFALYGKTSGAERDGGDMRSHYADDGTPTVVVFDFTVGQRKYRVQRSPSYEVAGRKTPIGPDATLWDMTGVDDGDGVGCEGRVIETGVRAVTARVEETLGFQADQFRQVVLLPQGQFRQALTADSAERREIMEILFGTERYRQIEAALKEEARSLQSRLEQGRDRRDTLLKQADAESVAELQESHEEACNKMAEAREAEKAAKDAAKKAAQALEVGKKNAEKLEEAADAAVALAELKAREEEIAAKRAELDAARRALSCASAEGLYVVAKEMAKEAEKEAASAARKLTEAEELAREAGEKLDEEKSPARAEERERAAKEVIHLESLKDKVDAIDEARGKAVEASIVVKSADEQAKEAAGKKKEADTELKEARDLLELTRKEASELPRWEAAVKEARQTLKRLQEREELEAEQAKKQEAANKAADAAEAAESRLAKAKEDSERLQDSWMSSQAAALAMSLTPGLPCPVCGSLDHPKPACRTIGKEEDREDTHDRVPSQNEIAEARSRVESLEEECGRVRKVAADAAQSLATTKGRLEALEMDVEIEEGESLADLILRLRDDAAQAVVHAEKAAEAEEQAERLEQQIVDLEQRLSDLEEELRVAEKARSEAEAKLAAAKAKVEEREAGVPVELRAPDALERALANAKDIRDSLRRKLEEAEKAVTAREQASAVARSERQAANRAADESGRTRDRRLREFEAKVATAGFGDLEAYEASKRQESQVSALERAIDDYGRQLHAAKVRLERAGEAAAGVEEPDLEALESEAKRLSQASVDAVATRAQLESEAEARKRLLGVLDELLREMADLEEQYSVAARIADVASGRKPNKLGMNFETFILASMLDKVAEAATRRLQVMSKGRYSLRRTLDRRTARSAGGLGLEVFDMYTGRERSVTTLSGGEGFMASLSLALGLADVVQSYAGGIHLDTMFIDEGFGALDPESLDLALDTLINLQRDSGRLVGVISHVPELEERIDARLEVNMTETGSTTRFVVG
jgi:exonuclease SbcC